MVALAENGIHDPVDDPSYHPPDSLSTRDGDHIKRTKKIQDTSGVENPGFDKHSAGMYNPEFNTWEKQKTR